MGIKNPHEMSDQQLGQIKSCLEQAYKHSSFYRQKYQELGILPEQIKTRADFLQLPFTSKLDLRKAYPLGLQAVPDEEVVRIHSSSGTTGLPVILPYTQKDVSDWTEMMCRCMTLAGMTKRDRIQVTPGYGLWTAGIGFQAGAERLGAMVIPTGPGNTEKQLEMLAHLHTTVLASTSSFALLLAEKVEERGLLPKLSLTKGIMGSERFGEKMRQRICEGLGIEIFDIYGLTELYGPGISMDCPKHQGLHYFNDFLYMEIIDPLTEQVLPLGEYGELVITSLQKQAAPLIRYRTRDITRLLPGDCSCGCGFPRHDAMIGRTDDQVKVRGVNIAPSQIDILLSQVPGASSEYQVKISKAAGKDVFELYFELEAGKDPARVQAAVVRLFKQQIGITPLAIPLGLGSLPRSEKKTIRIIDLRYL